MATQRKFPKKPDNDEADKISSQSPTTKPHSNDTTNNQQSWLIKHDVEWTEYLSVCATPESAFGFLRPVMKALEMSCHGIPWIVGVMTILTVAENKQKLTIFFNLLAGLLVDLVIVTFAKSLGRRQRPENNRMDMFATVSVDHYSLPSGHSTRAVFLAAFLLEHFLSGSTWTVCLLLWSGIVCLSRVMLGRHHLLDVLAGVVIGLVHYYAILPYYWMHSQTCYRVLKTIRGNF